jgi:hypothetical protein
MLLTGAASLEAGPTIQVTGVTAVQLDGDFLGTLQSAGLTLKATDRAAIRRNQAIFPVTSGVLDLGSFAAELSHLGGLSLARNSVRVELFNFIVDTTGSSSRLTGLVIVNGNLVGRIALFDLEVTKEPVSIRQFLVQGGIVARLSSTAATLLNQKFRTNVFAQGLDVGTMRLAAVEL